MKFKQKAAFGRPAGALLVGNLQATGKGFPLLPSRALGWARRQLEAAGKGTGMEEDRADCSGVEKAGHSLQQGWGCA